MCPRRLGYNTVLFSIFVARKASLWRESKYKKGEALVDEDGFTPVVCEGAYGQVAGGVVEVASRKFMEEHAKVYA